MRINELGVSSETNKDDTKVRCHSASSFLEKVFNSPLSQPCSHYLGKDHLPLCPGWLNSLPDSNLVLLQSFLHQAATAVFPNANLWERLSCYLNLVTPPCVSQKTPGFIKWLQHPPPPTSQLFCLHCFSYTCSPSLLQTHPWSCSSGPLQMLFSLPGICLPWSTSWTILTYFSCLSLSLTTSSLSPHPPVFLTSFIYSVSWLFGSHPNYRPSWSQVFQVLAVWGKMQPPSAQCPIQRALPSMFTGFSSQRLSGSSRMGDHSWVLKSLLHFAMWPARQLVTDWLPRPLKLQLEPSWRLSAITYVGRRDVGGLRWVVLPSLPLPAAWSPSASVWVRRILLPFVQCSSRAGSLRERQRERWLYCWFMLLSPQTHDAVNMGWGLVQRKAVLLMISTKGMIGNG